MNLFQFFSSVTTTESVRAEALRFIFFVLIVLVAIPADFVTGYRKARRLGKARTSEAMRRTVSKGIGYFSLLIIATLADSAFYISDIGGLVHIPELPYFSFVTTFFLLAVEWKSIKENISDKVDIAKEAKGIQDIVHAVLVELKKEKEVLDDVK